MQMRDMREHAANRGWTITMQVKEVGSGAAQRELREELLDATAVVKSMSCSSGGWSGGDGRWPIWSLLFRNSPISVSGFVFATKALDMTTATGRAMAGLLAVFAQFEHDLLRERLRAGLAEATLNGKRLGRSRTMDAHASRIRKLHRPGVSKAQIARRPAQTSPNLRPSAHRLGAVRRSAGHRIRDGHSVIPLDQRARRTPAIAGRTVQSPAQPGPPAQPSLLTHSASK